MPIGNITSQIFANIYLNKFDWFVKRTLDIKYYFRYCDDFVIIHTDRDYLEEIVKHINVFLNTKLSLDLHPNKIVIRRVGQGIDFLGYIILPHYIVLRTKTKRRMFKKLKKKRQELQAELISKESFNQSLQSYLGILKHCRGYKIEKNIIDLVG